MSVSLTCSGIVGNGGSPSVPFLRCKDAAASFLIWLHENGSDFTADKSRVNTIGETKADGDEQRLAARAAAGEVEAFSELVVRFQRPVMAFVWRVLRSVDDAEDAAQETFVRAWRAMPRFDAARPFKTWLFAIARNVAFTMLDQRRKESGLEGGWGVSGAVDAVAAPDAFERLKGARLEEALDAAVARLSPKAAAVFHLRHGEDMSIAEIAAALDMSESAVKVSLHRTRAALRRDLKEWLE